MSELESGVNQLQLELESQQARKQIEKKHGLSRNYQNRTKGYWINSAGYNFLCYSPLPLVCVDSLPGMTLTKAKYP